MKILRLTLLVLAVCFTTGAMAQMQINKALQLTGSGADAKIQGIQSVTDDDDAASKAYVDTTIAANLGGGLTGEYSNSTTGVTWQSPVNTNSWEDITLHSHTVGETGSYIIFASLEGKAAGGGTNQYYRINANGVLSSAVDGGTNSSTFTQHSLYVMADLSAGHIVKLQNQNNWGASGYKNTVKNIKISLVKVQ